MPIVRIPRFLPSTALAEPDANWGLCCLCQTLQPLPPGVDLCDDCAAVAGPAPTISG